MVCKDICHPEIFNAEGKPMTKKKKDAIYLVAVDAMFTSGPRVWGVKAGETVSSESFEECHLQLLLLQGILVPKDEIAEEPKENQTEVK